jgi:hypothetical protein
MRSLWYNRPQRYTGAGSARKDLVEEMCALHQAIGIQTTSNSIVSRYKSPTNDVFLQSPWETSQTVG